MSKQDRWNHRTADRKGHHGRRVIACKPLHKRLGRGPLSLGALDQMDHARERRVRPPARDLDLEGTPAVDRPREHFVAHVLLDRQRFAGDRSLVEVALARHHLSIERHFLPRPDHDDVAHVDLIDADAPLLGTSPYQGFDRCQVHQRADRAAGSIHAARFEQLCERKQKGDRRRFEPLADRHGSHHGNQHQHIDVQRERPSR